MNRIIILVLALLPLGVCAQENSNPYSKLAITGSIQSDILLPSEITDDMPEHFLTNTYLDLRAMSRHLDAGARFEYLYHPMPGFEPDFKGWGISNTYLKFLYDRWDLTLGSFYEQFGSGFILRTYEERTLGVDNSLLGARLGLRPFKGISLKVLGGTQRTYWNVSESLILGADGELSLDEWIRPLSEKGIYLSVGGSWVNKSERDEEYIVDKTHRLNFPRYVNAWDARIRLQANGLNVLAEYARKGADPNYLNGYIYRPGDVAMLSVSYSKKGLSALVQAKRSENMTFRSLRSEQRQTPSFLNHMPAFTLDHTYALAALYPYATQMDGEWAYQAELGYKFKKGTALGGKYGTSIKLNASYVRPIDIRPLTDSKTAGTDGYTSRYFNWGHSNLYHDVNVQVEKKFTKSFKLNFMYMNQLYNKQIIEKHEGDIIHSNIFVADMKFQLAKKVALRTELQYLQTRDDDRDWMFALAELSFAPHFMFTISDQWNHGTTNEHYYQGCVTFNWNAHRLQAGYGRTREGFNCTGGVCRRVPETKGVMLNYNYTF